MIGHRIKLSFVSCAFAWTLLLCVTTESLAEVRDTTPVMKLGSVRWHLKKQGVFELSADKSRLVIGDKLDSTISVVDVETGQVVRTLEQQFHKGHAQTGKFTGLIIDEHGQHIAINSYQSEVDSVGWVTS